MERIVEKVLEDERSLSAPVSASEEYSSITPPGFAKTNSAPEGEERRGLGDVTVKGRETGGVLSAGEAL